MEKLIVYLRIKIEIHWGSSIQERMIHSLVEEGDLGRVAKWIADVPTSLHEYNIHMETPFVTACANGKLSCANYLFEKGANIHTTNSYGEKALHKAAEHGHLDLVDFLLFHGADINAICNQHETPIMRSIRHNRDSVTLFLITKGANTNVFDGGGSTPLMLALCYGRQDLAMHMISLGASIHGSRSDSPLTLSAMFRFPIVMTKLLQNGALKDNKKCVQAMSRMLGNIPTHTYDMVKYMLDLGVNPNQKSRYANLPLIEACSRTVDYVQLLLDAGANPNLQGEYNNTPLIRASMCGSLSNVTLLLNHKANPNFKNQYGKTALSIACERGQYEMVHLLLPYCKLSMKVKDQENYLMCAARSGNVDIACHLLRFHRYPIHDTNKHGLTAYNISNRYGNYNMTCFLAEVEVAQSTTTMDHLEDVAIYPDVWALMLPPVGQHELDRCRLAYRVDSFACYHALFLNEDHLLMKFRAGEIVPFSQAPIRALTRAMGNRPIRNRIVEYLIFNTVSRRLFSRLIKR